MGIRKALLVMQLIGFSLVINGQSAITAELIETLKKGKASVEEISALISKGADVNGISEKTGWSYGMSPVHIAAAWHKLDWLKLLVEKGADLFRVNEYDRPKGEWWSEMHHDCNALHIAIYYYDGKDPSLLNYLVKKGFDLNAYCYGGQTPLMYALMSKHTDINAIKFLVENGADVKKLRKGDTEGVLYYCCDDDVRQRKETTEYLIQKGASANMGPNYGNWTLLTKAIYFHYNEVAKLLIDYKVIDINGPEKVRISNENDVLTDMGNYLNLAVKRNNLEMTKFLMDKGVSTDVKTGDNETAFDIAKRLQLKAMILLLTTGDIPDSEKEWLALTQSDEYSDVEFKSESAIKKFSGKLLNGSGVNNDSYKGKVVFMNFWATWCGYCIQEMPSMQKLSESINNQKFTIVAVSTDKQADESKVHEYVKKNNYKFNWVYDPGWKDFDSYNTSLPGTFLLDKNGLIVAEVQGSRDWTKPKYKKLIEVLLSRL